MMRGELLWLHHNRVPQAGIVAIAAAIIIRAAATIITADGGGLDVTTLWLACAVTLPLVFTFTAEDDIDKTARRSLPARRATLVLLAMSMITIASVALTPASTEGLGPLATWRTAAGLLGLGLLGQAFIAPAAIWVLPLLATMASMLFAWPLHPTTMHTVMGAFRAPARLHLDDGTVNLSLPIGMSLLLTGAAAYMAGIRPSTTRLPHHPAATRRARSLAASSRAAMRRASLTVPLTVAVGLVSLLVSLSSLNKWGGSPRLLLANEIPSSAFMHVPLGAVIGAVVGQTRWRTGVTVWQRISPRPMTSLIASCCLRACAITAAALLAPALLLAVCADIDLSRHAAAAVALSEFFAGWIPTLLVVLEACAVAIVTAIIGWLWRGPWIAPLCLIAGLALMIPMPRIPTQNVDVEWSQEYSATACTPISGSGGSVCTVPPLAGYLPAAANSIADIYRNAPRRDLLPRRVVLVNHGVMGITAGGLSEPSIGINRNHGILPPTRWTNSQLDTLVYSIHAWCPSTDAGDVQKILGSETWAPSPTMNMSILAMESCRTK